ncbi:efflux RND transporter periplasmic adaptor subunit [Azospirillum sp. YIM B02556]|uniref:Efflux RND transporter periplasmic adaptor subunit n=1 Tax=Azospirillum endophyticum TaxID=2800326 RepID=A0ABS1FEQ0_9PROT|nr:efflux RND transporter periplasmic adaptor subunit [Azospirillum endophyticum]MBK1841912.1 efflux RND transporter periplasmic adaptor subunit [Azospirillum endophyticum]
MTLPLSDQGSRAERTATAPRHGGLRPSVWLAGLALLLLAGGALLYSAVGTRSGAPAYRTGPVTRGAVTASITASGTVNPVVTVQVGSQVSGQISELLADFNTEVKTGQLVARIDPALFETQVAQAAGDLAVARAGIETQRATVTRAAADLEAARAALTTVQAQLRKAQAVLVNAQNSFERTQRLFERGNASASDRDGAKAANDAAQADVEALAAQQTGQQATVRSGEAQLSLAQATLTSAAALVQQKEAAYQGARINLEHTRIAAPVDGTVIQRNVDRGQTVAASLQAPVLFTIAQDLAAMQVDASVDEADVGAVRLGQEVRFTVDAYPGRGFTGRVLQIRKAPQVVQNVVTYDVVISAPNPDLALLPGLTANIRIIAEHRDDALLIPNAALRYRPAKAPQSSAPPSPQTGEVWLLGSSGQPERRPLRLGISDGTVVEIVEGKLAPGDRVVLSESATAAGTGAVPSMGAGPRF